MSVKIKKKRMVPVGIAHIKATFNNTIISITDAQGNVLAASSAGAKGFRGARKSTPYAAQVAAEDVGRRANDLGMKTVSVRVTGPGNGREAAIRALGAVGFTITSVKDITPIPHNGCRLPNQRRV